MWMAAGWVNRNVPIPDNRALPAATGPVPGGALKRREFLASSLAASALALGSRVEAAPAGADPATGKPRQYYELRKYDLQQGHQSQLTGKYVADALIPALNKMGIGPVGAFNLFFGEHTPILYLLLPANNLDTLVNAELKLRQDENFLAAADAFWNAPESSPPFQHVESSLLIAFESWPQLVLPPPGKNGRRVFQLRSYISATNRDHVRKVKMVQSGESEIFARAGFWQVFFGDALIGHDLPNLTYMLSFSDLTEVNDLWNKFFSDPQWKKLAAMPEFSFEPIVANVTSLILNPAPFSQI